VVVVPPAADRLVGLHQHVEPPPLGAVEVLHPERLPIAGPLVELGARQREGGRGQHLGDQTLRAEPLGQLGRGVRGRLVHHDRPAQLLQRLAVGLRAQVSGPVAELRGQVPHARQHQVQLLAVEPPPVQDPARLDQHHLAVQVLVGAMHVRTQLITEHPQRGVVVAVHGLQCGSQVCLARPEDSLT
jgi:hypothetical protein